MRGAIGAELLGVLLEAFGVEDRRIVLVAVIAIELGEHDAHGVLVRLHELLAGGGREIDLLGARGAAAKETTAEEKSGQNLHNKFLSWSRRTGNTARPGHDRTPRCQPFENGHF